MYRTVQIEIFLILHIACLYTGPSQHAAVIYGGEVCDPSMCIFITLNKLFSKGIANAFSLYS